MAFENQVTISVPAPVVKTKRVVRAFSTATDNEAETPEPLEVKEGQNQLILHIQYVSGNADYLEYRILCRTGEDTIGYQRPHLVARDGYYEDVVKPRRIIAAGNYEIALPICCDYVAIETAVIGDVTDCQYGIRMIIGTA